MGWSRDLYHLCIEGVQQQKEVLGKYAEFWSTDNACMVTTNDDTIIIWDVSNDMSSLGNARNQLFRLL